MRDKKKTLFLHGNELLFFKINMSLESQAREELIFEKVDYILVWIATCIAFVLPNNIEGKSQNENLVLAIKLG